MTGGGAAAGTAQYDSIGIAYDFVGGLDSYHRIFWGVSTRAYREFAEKAGKACGEGLMLDAGCGSMLFSARVHQRHEQGAVIGADASIEMLRLARGRLGGDRQPRRVALLNADVLRSPFRAATFDVVICLHVAHVLEDLEGLLGELRRILKPGGRLFLTSVVLVNGWRDRYLRMLSRRGVMASPRRTEDILGVLRAVFGTEPESRLIGSMLFVETQTLPGSAAIRAAGEPSGRTQRESPSQRVCVIIPAYNEAGVISETLSHVNRAVEYLHGHSPHSTSVLLVDNASSDRTAEIARASGAIVVRERERNIAAVRNAGAKAATADVLVFLDADTIVPETFLQRIMQVMADPGCVGGAVDTRYEPRRLLVRLYLTMWRVLGALTGAAQGAAQFYRRDCFFEVGGYDETLYMGEDVEFHWRMLRAARTLDRRCCLVRDIRVIPSSRRFDQWPLWRTLLWTNPLTAFLWRKRKAAWGEWYERPLR